MHYRQFLMGAYFTLESSSTSFPPDFGTLQRRLLQILRRKLNNGEFTERGLARLTGISQPQVHNLLKGARKLSLESADIFLEALQLSVLDLLTEADLAAIDPESTPPLPGSGAILRSEPDLRRRKDPTHASLAHFRLEKRAS